MPGYIIHLTEAELVLDLLRSKKDLSVDINDQWAKLFLCANLIPDAVPKDNKKQSHFWDEKEMSNILVVPCIRKFLHKYKLNLQDPMLTGYFTHLYLDKVFYDDYFRQWIEFYNISNRQEQNAAQVSYAQIVKTGEIVSISRLFSEEYIYGDYTRLNNYFINHYNIQIPWDVSPNNILIEEARQYNLKNVFNELKMYLKKYPNSQQELKIFTEESLDNFLVQTSQNVVDLLLDYFIIL